MWFLLPAESVSSVQKGLAIFAILLVGLSLPLVSWVLGLLLAGYLAYVLRTSAEGGKHLPDFPEFRDVWDGIVLPLLLLGFSLAVALTPAILYSRYAGWDFSDPVAWVLCGCSSWPAAPWSFCASWWISTSCS